MQIVRYLALAGVFSVVCFSGCWDNKAGNGSGNTSAVNYSSSPAKPVNSKPEQNTAETNTNMSEKKTAAGFAANMPGGFQSPADDVGKKLLKEYGSMFVAKGGATAPKTVVFKDESEVSAFQSGLSKSTETIGGFAIELQSPAMNDLKKAIEDAKKENLTISPRGVDSGRRTYNETVGLWASRVEPALKHWVAKGKITQVDADRIKSLSPFEQVSEVLKLEEKGIYFAKDLSKSIIYSVAPPGTSQHLAMLALDVKEFENPKVREILARHNWYQTVVSDLPHFTYLGVPETELPNLGLKRISDNGRTFWIPEL
ncbi:MAG: D-alanyl-D-alanine carboxypeptidase family protein [Saprospiraceae bacterium]|nr:D-alanyl-D-alanine carboxypeptidase family protein [Pyrinomonadaceae bacterium]